MRTCLRIRRTQQKKFVIPININYQNPGLRSINFSNWNFYLLLVRRWKKINHWFRKKFYNIFYCLGSSVNCWHSRDSWSWYCSNQFQVRILVLLPVKKNHRLNVEKLNINFNISVLINSHIQYTYTLYTWLAEYTQTVQLTRRKCTHCTLD